MSEEVMNSIGLAIDAIDGVADAIYNVQESFPEVRVLCAALVNAAFIIADPRATPDAMARIAVASADALRMVLAEDR